MSDFVFKLPDLGEGMVEAEVLEWHVAIGDQVVEGEAMVDVMTDKANVEVPAPTSGMVVTLGGAVGDIIPVGAMLVTIGSTQAVASNNVEEIQEVAEESLSAPKEVQPAAPPAQETALEEAAAEETPSTPNTTTGRTKVLASPAIRRHAQEAGVDLGAVSGSGPKGRILRRDLAAAIDGTGAPTSATSRTEAIEEIKVRGVRRVIAKRMSASKREIPHFSYVDELDATELDGLRAALNADAGMTFLPLIALALIRALPEHPLCNAHYLSDDETIRRFDAVHLGIATQTPSGLKVPVVHNAHRLDLWQLAAQISAVTQAARDGTAAVEQLSGSTITLTSLGKLGGIASTPVINAPEVAVIGINKAVPRPVVRDGQVCVRTMMNLSASFDHRIIDGFDGASFIASIKTRLENPGLIFIAKP